MQLLVRPSILLYALAPLLADTLSLDTSSPASIKNVSSIVAKDMLSYYNGTDPGQIPGLFGLPYQWWESGVVWGSLIDYWNYTGDAQYVSLVQQALLGQVGPDKDYMPPNQTKTEGNDDQAIWALAAMRAAELQLPNPSSSPSWLDLAVNVFNDQVTRWDTQTCGGGLRWQIFSFNLGYNYKNSLSNGAFFQLAARLAKYTGNQTYADWATKSYDWSNDVGLVGNDFEVFDGTSVYDSCETLNRLRWTYAAGSFMYGSAVMTNFTNANETWQDRTNSLLSAMNIFFSGDQGTSSDTSTASGIMTEVACESIGPCSTDTYAYKGLTAQWMGEALQIAPFLTDKIQSLLQSSAEGAARQCSGGDDGTMCGTEWTKTEYDHNTGLGQELSALNVFLANLAANSSAPTNANTTVSSGSQTSGGKASSSGTSSSTGTSSSKPSSGSLRLSCSSTSLTLTLIISAMAFLPLLLS